MLCSRTHGGWRCIEVGAARVLRPISARSLFGVVNESRRSKSQAGRHWLTSRNDQLLRGWLERVCQALTISGHLVCPWKWLVASLRPRYMTGWGYHTQSGASIQELASAFSLTQCLAATLWVATRVFEAGGFSNGATAWPLLPISSLRDRTEASILHAPDCYVPHVWGPLGFTRSSLAHSHEAPMTLRQGVSALLEFVSEFQERTTREGDEGLWAKACLCASGE